MPTKETVRTKLTRADMEDVLKAGGSVMYDGEVLTRVEDLPDDADLAQGDERREAEVGAALDAQIATLQAQKSRLGAARGASVRDRESPEFTATAGNEPTPGTHEAVGTEADRTDAPRGLLNPPKSGGKK